MHNYYEILAVDPLASEEVIRVAIRTTRKRYRQVAGSPNKEQARNAESMMDRLAEAEVELLDGEKRKVYDAKLSRQPKPQPESEKSTSDDWIETAKEYLANGQPRNASQAARHATMATPDSVEAWTIRTYAALELRDFQEADFAASEAARRDPGNPELAGLLGDVYDGEGRFDDAERAFSKAANLDPENPYWQGRVAWALCDQGHSLEAVALAEKLADKFPKNEYVKHVRVSMLLADAENALSKDGNAIYYTNKRQVSYVEKRLEEVALLGELKEAPLEHYTQTKQLLDAAKKRRFLHITFRRIIANIILIMLTLLLLASDVYGFGIVFLIVTGLFVWWTIEKCWPYQWKINKSALGAIAKTGLQ